MLNNDNIMVDMTEGNSRTFKPADKQSKLFILQKMKQRPRKGNRVIEREGKTFLSFPSRYFGWSNN